MSSKLLTLPPAQKASPQILAERSVSSKRSGIYSQNELSRPIIIINKNRDESVENGAGVETFSVKASHLRHASPTTQQQSNDIHPAALHPINLNSKLDLCSHLPDSSPAKVSTKLSSISGKADKESSFISAPLYQKEGEEETPAERSSESQECLLQDAHEESCSTSFSVESKSPRREDFILWGNAVFCGSETRDLSSCDTGSSLKRQSENFSRETNEGQTQNCEQSRIFNHLSSFRDGLLSLEYNIKPDGCCVATMASSVAGSSSEVTMAAFEESLKPESSVGSTLSVHDSLMIRHPQEHPWEDFSKQRALLNFEAQGCCLNYGGYVAQDMEASDCEKPAEEKVEDSKNSGKEKEQEKDSCIRKAEQGVGSVLSSFSDAGLHKEGILMAADEVKIRAELEVEIERDLEQEIKTKISLLSKRLEELHVLQASRYSRQEQSSQQKAAMKGGILLSISEADDSSTVTQVIKEEALPKIPFHSIQKRSAAVEHGKALSQAEKTMMHPSLAPSRKQLPVTSHIDKDVHYSYASTPVTSWRKLATTSGWASHTKENNLCLPLPNSGHKSIRTAKHSIATTVKPNVQVESTSSFKQEIQRWTTVETSKRFDWIRTLRSDVSNSTMVSTLKLECDLSEETSASIPFVNDTLCANVVRTLFPEDGLSTPAKAFIKLSRRDSSTILSGNLRKSALSSSTRHGNHAATVVSTPHNCNASSGQLKHDKASSSASAKRLGQKPPSGVKAYCDPGLVQKTTELRQAKNDTSAGKCNSGLRASPQQASAGKIDRHGNVKGPCFGNGTSLSSVNVPSAHAEELKRHGSGLRASSQQASAGKIDRHRNVKGPCFGNGTSVSSVNVPSAHAEELKRRGNNVSSARTSSKEMQNPASKISPRPGSCSSHTNKGRIVPSNHLGRRQSGTLKAPGASLKGKSSIKSMVK